jgi:hypothetical protein
MQAILIDQKLKSLVASERKITHEILFDDSDFGHHEILQGAWLLFVV